MLRAQSDEMNNQTIITFGGLAALLIFRGMVLYDHSQNEQAESCYPITSKELRREKAPKFEDFPARENVTSPASVDLKSHRLARTYRTQLRRGAARGPNFGAYYTVVGWGCGTSCVSFAIVNARTGRVIFPERISNVSGVHLHADDFEPGTNSPYWGLRYRLDSRLLILVGSLNEDEEREGAFYYVMENDRLRPVFSVRVRKRYCER